MLYRIKTLLQDQSSADSSADFLSYLKLTNSKSQIYLPISIILLF